MMYCGTCCRPRRKGELRCPCSPDTHYIDHVPKGKAPPDEHWPVEAGPMAGLVSLPPGEVLALYGPPGVGKSTLAMLSMPEADVASTEMTDYWMKRYRGRLKLSLDARTFVPTEDDEGHVDLGLPEADARDVIFDTPSTMRWSKKASDAFMAYCARHAVRGIIVLHVTADGKAWGGTHVPHAVHSVVHLTPDGDSVVLHCTKQRDGSRTRMRWSIHAGSEAAAAPRAYYSVEGSQAKGFRLVQFPFGGDRVRHAQVYERAKKLKLSVPPPPLAVAAAWSEWTGWTEPTDHAARAAYAESLGVPYWTPVQYPDEKEG